MGGDYRDERKHGEKNGAAIHLKSTRRFAAELANFGVRGLVGRWRGDYLSGASDAGGRDWGFKERERWERFGGGRWGDRGLGRGGDK